MCFTNITRERLKLPVTAVHLTLQPVYAVPPSVSKNRFTMLVLLVKMAGSGRPLPLILGIRVVPSPSVIVKKS